MKLLNLYSVEKEKLIRVDSQTDRIKKLRNAEDELVKKFNRKKVFIEQENKRISDELDAFIKEVNTKKETLKNEVSFLEHRKKEALKPIQEQRKQANELLDLAKKQQVEIKVSFEEIQKQKEELLELKLQISEERDELVEIRDRLTEKEKSITEQEKRNKQSTKELSNKWVEFHKSIHSINSDIKRRGNEVSDREKVVVTIRESLDNEEKELRELKRKLQDERATLDRAWYELKNK